MKRLILALLVLFASGAFVAVVFFQRPPPLTLHSANATRIGESATYMIGLTVDNAGAPDVVTEVSVPDAAMARVMGASGDLIVPGDGTGIFAMDGAHIMVRLNDDAVEAGGFLPVTLSFASGAQMAARAKVQDGMGMDHSLANGVSIDPSPTLDVMLEDAGPEGVRISLKTENFKFVRTEDTADHVAGEGHAHVYLNGLKLARLYDLEFETGALPTGANSLYVALNTNDHRPYVAKGSPVSATVEFDIK